MNPRVCGSGKSYSRTAKVPGALMLYQSFLAKVSVFFLRPFFPFERRLFLPTAMITSLVVGRRDVVGCRRRCRRARIQRQCGVENLSEPSSASRAPRPHKATAIRRCTTLTAMQSAWLDSDLVDQYLENLGRSLVGGRSQHLVALYWFWRV